MAFTRWMKHEPNNSADGDGEDYAWYANRGGDIGWDDYENVPQAIGTTSSIWYVVGYDNVVPEPAAPAIVSFFMAIFFYCYRRRLRYTDYDGR